MKAILPEKGGCNARAASIFAMAATTVLSLALSSNAFLGQGTSRQSFASAGGDPAIPGAATTRMQVDAPAADGTTIRLKYDPVVEDTQRQLLTAGYYKGLVDGVLGRKTRNAIAEYQKSAGLEVTGEPSPELIEHIRFTREVAEAQLFTGSVDDGSDAEQRASVRRVQTGLAELAYSPGAIDGELNSSTRKAILAFQRDRKLPETGEITEDLIAELAKLSGQSGVVAD